MNQGYNTPRSLLRYSPKSQSRHWAGFKPGWLIGSLPLPLLLALYFFWLEQSPYATAFVLKKYLPLAHLEMNVLQLSSRFVCTRHFFGPGDPDPGRQSFPGFSLTSITVCYN